jgi:hypothetical protein
MPKLVLVVAAFALSSVAHARKTAPSVATINAHKIAGNIYLLEAGLDDFMNGGNTTLQNSGATTIAHRNVRERFSSPYCGNGVLLPMVTFYRDLTALRSAH